MVFSRRQSTIRTIQFTGAITDVVSAKKMMLDREKLQDSNLIWLWEKLRSAIARGVSLWERVIWILQHDDDFV
jgi:hypothetical protein